MEQTGTGTERITISHSENIPKQRVGDDDMKKGLVVLILIAGFVLLSGCDGTSDRYITTAKIRYFDGTTDTVIVESYNIASGGILHIRTDAGRTVTISANNVILITETEAQYNCQE